MDGTRASELMQCKLVQYIENPGKEHQAFTN